MSTASSSKKLGVFLKGGAASGDPDVVGLSQYEDLATQPVGQKNVSNFSFHPDYRIDLILWRRIMGRIAGAYYLAPAVSYDIIRSDFGRVLGAKLDFIYSRAMYEQQTYASEPNLGAELDVAIYYRTENGPKFTDGFFASAFQFGILFPLNGLKYLEVNGIREPGTEGLGITRAMTLRLILGIQLLKRRLFRGYCLEKRFGFGSDAPLPAALGKDDAPELGEGSLKLVVDDHVIEERVVPDLFARLVESESARVGVVGTTAVQPAAKLLHRRRQDEDADGVRELFLDLTGTLVVDVE